MKRIRFLALLAVMIFAATGVISKAAAMSVDASFSDWENVKKHQASGNLSEVAMVVNGDRVYVYAKEGNGMNSAISWGQQLAFVTKEGKKIDFSAYQTSYGWQEAVRTLNIVDGSGKTMKDVSGMAAYLSDSNCYQWEMCFPVSLFGDTGSVSLTDASGNVVYVKDISVAKAESSTKAEPTTEAPTTEAATTAAAATTEAPTTQSKPSTSGIVVDGYYEDWTNIDVKDALTWYSNNKQCNHKAGIYMDGKDVYVHVKMHELYQSQIPLTNFVLTVNNEKPVQFSAQFANADGTIDWSKSDQVYHLPVGTTTLSLFYSQYPPYNMGDIAVTVYNEKHVSDEFEFRVDLSVLAKITGIPEDSIREISFNCSNIGGNSIHTSGTSTGAAVGVGICIAFVAYIWYRKSRKQVQE